MEELNIMNDYLVFIIIDYVGNNNNLIFMISKD